MRDFHAFRVGVMLILAVLGAGHPRMLGAGLVVSSEPVDPGRGVAVWGDSAGAQIRSERVDVSTRIRDQIAVTRLEQVLRNHSSRRLEGTFLLPLPKGAHVKEFKLLIDGKPTDAELLGAEKARGIYEDIVRRAADPALMEYVGRDLVRVRIFPFEPGSTRTVQLSWTEVLSSDHGLVRFVHPLTHRESGRPDRAKVRLRLDLETTEPLRTLYSPSHSAGLRRTGDRTAVFELDGEPATGGRGFELFFGTEGRAVGASLLAENSGEGDAGGHFLLFLSAGMGNDRAAKPLPKDIVFVVDTSGSMAGPKLAQAKRALLFCIENLNESDRFEVIRFATETESLFGGLRPATSVERSRAREFVDGLGPIGGTAIAQAMETALGTVGVGSERPRVVLFLTDGMPTVGVTGTDEILGALKLGREGEKQGGAPRVFCFGIGADVNTHLLDRLSEVTRAHSQYVLGDEDLEVKLSNFYSKIKDPVLTGLKLSFPEGVRVQDVYPRSLPDLHKGDQLVISGRYRGHGKGKLRLEGRRGEESVRQEFDLGFPERSVGNEFVPRLWATRRVGFLLDEVRLRGESKELKDEIVALSRKHGIVTPYTAYLIVEDEHLRRVPAAAQTMNTVATNAHLRGLVRESFQEFRTDVTGNAAVAGSKTTLSLKDATTTLDPTLARRYGLDAIRPREPDSFAAGGAERRLAAPLTAKPAAVGRAEAVAGAAERDSLDVALGEVKHVGGRAFYQNGLQWVESGVQQLAGAKPRRIQFNSPEYFAFARDNAGVRPWLALGRNIQFVWNGTVFEIHE